MHKVGVLVSGRGSNLQAIMDRIADGYLPLEIAVVISDKPDAYALERAQKADIKTVAVERKACASKEEFEAKINAALEAEGCELVVLAGFDAEVNAEAWEIPVVFKKLQEWGNVPWAEMYRTFNMGVGMVLVVDPSEADAVRAHLTEAGETFYELGKVVPGHKETIMKGGVFGA